MDGVGVAQLMDNIFGDGNSGDDPRFEYDVGDHVQLARDGLKEGGARPAGWPGKKGDKFQIVARRNGYPPPYFDCWFPLYFIESLQGSEFGGEVGPNWLEPINEVE